MKDAARSSILALAFLSLCLVACEQQPPKKAVRTPDVTVVRPVQREVTRYLEYTGNTVALQTVEIRARVAGFLERMYFEPRAKVKDGEMLFLIDPRQYEASVKEAQGKLDAKKASWKLAQTELQISQQLESKEAISPLRLEKKVAERDSAKAEAELAEADLDQAKLNLEWTKVISPINGRVSRNKVDIGNLVGATEKTLLTTVVDDDPIYAYFNLSELDLLPLLRQYAKDPASMPSYKLPLFLGLADETGFPHEGHFDFAETVVDASTGTIQVRGKFPNPDGLLLPGMYVRVRVPVAKRVVWLIPDVAVQFDQGGKYVLVVDSDNTVQHKRIKMGEQADDMRVIEQGLTPDDRVIVAGTQRARPGFKANPVTNEAASPQPETVKGNTQHK